MTCRAPFEVETVCRSTSARVGKLMLQRATVETPIFMPVGTQAAIRTMPPSFLGGTKASIILANTYHLHQRPGEELIEKLGGLHRFMAVDNPILTDSGGFQVFSLQKKEVSEEGVLFGYEVDGKKTFLSPERSMAIQMALGSDIAMAFDECMPPEADHGAVERSVDMTARWAERCLAAHDRPDQSLFGIVQGGMFNDLRRRSLDQITSLPFDGFAVGGLSVGEGPEIMNEVLGEMMPHMPPTSARYLMGVGRPQDLVDGVALGIDMFDCVIPTRHARGGALYTFQGRIRITHSRYRRDTYPIDTACECYTCTNFSRAYVHHLYAIGEVLGSTLATIHNLRFFGDLMERIREAIRAGTFATFRKDIKALYPEKGAEKPSGREAAGPHGASGRDAAQRRMADKAKPVSRKKGGKAQRSSGTGRGDAFGTSKRGGAKPRRGEDVGAPRGGGNRGGDGNKAGDKSGGRRGGGRSGGRGKGRGRG